MEAGTALIPWHNIVDLLDVSSDETSYDVFLMHDHSMSLDHLASLMRRTLLAFEDEKQL